MTYEKANKYLSIINIILKSESLTWDDREQFILAKIAFEDAMTAINAKLGNVQEIFQVMSKHEKIAKSEVELKKLIENSQSKSEEIIRNMPFEVKNEIFDFSNEFLADKDTQRNEFRNFCFLLNNVVINYKKTN